jgi:DNA (cytosine-5)-methyltransferase 1
MTFKVLDLFSCEGGAGLGYTQAGLALAASVDSDANAIRNNRNGGPKIAADWREGVRLYATKADLIHASPPCQGYIPGNKNKEAWDRLVNDVRAELLKTGKPFVIENVPTCEDLQDPISLTGCMFGLTVKWDVPKKKVRRTPEGKAEWEIINGRKWKTSDRTYEDVMSEGAVVFHLERHRKFEIHGFGVLEPLVNSDVHKTPAISVVHGTPTGFWNQWYAAVVPSVIKKQIMGAPDWMSAHGVAESIPPAYTRYIGEQFLASRQ